MTKLFDLKSPWPPCGDQPKAIEALVKGIEEKRWCQTLLGITGSGKTFTMANVIDRVNRPAIILAHNKTLAAQLYQEFKSLFPNNAVEYFVSYYDYYQPEAYIARTDTYIEKDMSINDKIDQLRIKATYSLLERRDVIIIASVSCIYGLGSPEFFSGMQLKFRVNEEIRRDNILLHLVAMQYKRNDFDFSRGTFRIKGDVLDIFPSYEDKKGVRVEFFGDEIDRLSTIDTLTGKVIQRLETYTLYPGSHHVTPELVREHALQTIKSEMQLRVDAFEKSDQLIERQRIFERTCHDMEMIKEIGFCKGIENYSRHFSQREEGEPPSCLLDYFPDDYLVFADESHQSLPQMRGMYHGDRSRKDALVSFGFRLPSAYDNRPLKFEEFIAKIPQCICVSATPGPFELEHSHGHVVEQVIRPTGLLDPKIEVRKADSQVDDSLEEIRKSVKDGDKILLTTLTKRLSEELAGYLQELGVRAKYLHSDIDTIERMQIIEDLRKDRFDVLIGINLLREGLDIPEVSLVIILDADKEGFLRSETSLIQTCGRAARNVKGRVIMYADRMTNSIKRCLAVTERRRKVQDEYNKKHGIIPKTIIKDRDEIFPEDLSLTKGSAKEAKNVHLTRNELQTQIDLYKKKMKEAAEIWDFEEAAKFRDKWKAYEKIWLNYS